MPPAVGEFCTDGCASFGAAAVLLGHPLMMPGSQDFDYFSQSSDE
jgi:hypothetical protein